MSKWEANILEALLDISVPIQRAVFLTYQFNPDMFQATVYPELRKRGCQRILLLMDRNQYRLLSGIDGLEQTGRVALEHFRPGSLFHPKVFVVAGERQFRCVVGSANLTHNGFEDNRELFSAFSEKEGDLDGLIQLLERVSACLPTNSTAIKILRDTVAELKATRLSHPRPSAIPIMSNGLGQTLWDQLNADQKGSPIKKAIVMCPYFEAPENFEHGLISEWLEKGISVELYLPFDQKISRVPRDEIAGLVQRHPKLLKLYGIRTHGKMLHGKLIGLMSSSKAWLLTGSANFTYSALKGKNVEVCLLFRMRRSDAQNYLDRLLVDARPIHPEDLPAPEPNTPLTLDPRATDFILSALLSIADDRLVVKLDRPWNEICNQLDALLVELGGRTNKVDFTIPDADTIEVSPASSYLKDGGDKWHPGTIKLRTVDGSAEDWRLIELAEGEALDDDGTQFVQPANIEDFVSSLLTHRRTPPGVQPVTDGAGKLSYYETYLADTESKLDRAFRLANGLGAHFSCLIKDPYTFYRWQNDWLALARCLQQDENIPQVGRALIAARLFAILDAAISPDVPHAQKALVDNPPLISAVRELYLQALAAPFFAAPNLSKIVQQGEK